MNASKAEPTTDETTYVAPPSPNSASTRQEASIAEQVVLQQPVLPGDARADVEMAPAPAEPDSRQVKFGRRTVTPAGNRVLNEVWKGLKGMMNVKEMLK